METSIENKLTVDTFIFVHDQEIVLDFINKNKFNDFKNFKWVFLGDKPYDKIQKLDNLIIVRNLEHNIEQYPKLTSFTGWYALHKNNLITSDYVNFFEYDINYVPEFVDINKEMIKRNFDFIGYFPMIISDIVYIKQEQYSIELINSVREKTGFDITKMINNLQSNNPRTMWSSSSNSTWKVSELKNYIEWFADHLDNIVKSNFSGHIHERSLSFYYFMKNLKVFLVQNLMIHVQLNSHGTSPLPPERAKELYKLL
jgi:hypothetical protein